MVKNGTSALKMEIMGTQGYMAPKYFVDGFVSPNFDVFSFGVVLLEMISSNKSIVQEREFH